MFLKDILIVLIIIQNFTTFGKNIPINAKSGKDLFSDEGLEGSGVLSESSFVSTTIKASEVEVENNFVDSVLTSVTLKSETPDKPNPSVTSGVINNCNTDSDKFNEKINEILEKYIPETLKLKSMKRGSNSQIVLDNGRLTVSKDYKVMGQSLCTQVDERTKKYDITLSINNLMGFYDWKIYNLFGYNFSESALITIKQLITELVITENNDLKTRLEDIKIGRIDDLKVKVNIPERISTFSLLKPMLEYIISRITTSIANRSMDSIVSNLRDIFYDSIQDKLKINP